jgi:hypothetical protein
MQLNEAKEEEEKYRKLTLFMILENGSLMWVSECSAKFELIKLEYFFSTLWIIEM